MTHTFDGYNYLIVLQKGEELLESLAKFVTETDIRAAWLTGLGAALEMEIGYYDLEKREYRWQTFAQLCEIASLTGNISRDDKGEPAFHLHGTFSDETFQTVGGHINKLVVGGTCEIFMHEFRQPLERQFDEETGLKLLTL